MFKSENKSEEMLDILKQIGGYSQTWKMPIKL